MSEKRFVIDEKTNYKDYPIILDTNTGDWWVIQDTMMGTGKLLDLLNEQQEQLDLYKEAILTMLGLLADKGIIFSGVKDE